MTESRQIDVVIVQPSAPDPKAARKWKVFWTVADLIAILFWSYAIVKIFVFDVDVYRVSLASPELVWVLNYKFLIFLGLILIAMLVTRSSMLGLAVAYIALYPLVVVFWKLPIFVWKQQSWLFAFAILNSLIGLFRSFRRTFISATLFLISTVFILTTGNQYVLYASSLVILILIVITYVLAFVRAFRPSAVFQTYMKVFPAIRKNEFLRPDASVRNLPVETMTAKQLELRTSGLQNVVIYNRVCLLISKKMRDYQRSGANVASYVLSVWDCFCLSLFRSP